MFITAAPSRLPAISKLACVARRGLEKHVDLCHEALQRLAMLAAATLGLGMDGGAVEQDLISSGCRSSIPRGASG